MFLVQQELPLVSCEQRYPHKINILLGIYCTWYYCSFKREATGRRIFWRNGEHPRYAYRITNCSVRSLILCVNTGFYLLHDDIARNFNPQGNRVKMIGYEILPEEEITRTVGFKINRSNVGANEFAWKYRIRVTWLAISQLEMPRRWIRNSWVCFRSRKKLG